MVYLDHAATTPMLPEAVQAMVAALGDTGNPSSLHASGRRARRSVEESRERIAAALGARPSEVILTSGGTAADNLAVKGIFWSRSAAEPQRRRILASAVEHHAVLDTVEWLVAHEQAEVTWLPVDAYGRVQPDVLATALATHGEQTALVSIQWANNEVGTVQPVAELVAIAQAHGVPFHTDAVQAVGQLPVDFAASGADAMTVTGHKFGGPVGTSVLLLGRDVGCTPLLHGGGQERGVHSGTLDTAGTAGFAVAVEAATKAQPDRARQLSELRDGLVRRLLEQVPDAVLNGDPGGRLPGNELGRLPGNDLGRLPGNDLGRLPGNAHFSFSGCEGDSLLMLLDARGIECSTGSACSAGVARPSHVLLAMGADEQRARGSLRFSLGHTSLPADVDALVEAIGPVVERVRRAGMS